MVKIFAHLVKRLDTPALVNVVRQFPCSHLVPYYLEVCVWSENQASLGHPALSDFGGTKDNLYLEKKRDILPSQERLGHGLL